MEPEADEKTEVTSWKSLGLNAPRPYQTNQTGRAREVPGEDLAAVPGLQEPPHIDGVAVPAVPSGDG